MKKYIQILIIESNYIFRKGLSIAIQSFSGFNVIAATDKYDELLNNQIGAIPDICLLDTNYCKINDAETIQKIKDKWPDIKILALPTYDYEFNLLKLIQQGADGYVLKTASAKDLHRALLSVYYTGNFQSGLLTQKVSDIKPRHPFITDIEIQFLSFLCSDMSYQEIGEHMDLSLDVVEDYRDILFNKFKVNSRIGLIVVAYKMKIITPAALNDDMREAS